MIERILSLMKNKGVTAQELTKSAGLNNSAITEWKKGKAKPSTEAIIKIADYFNVSTDYVLGLSNNPNPADLIIPDILKGVPVAFHRGEFEGLTQDEVDALAVIAKTLKAQRKL